MTIFYVLIYYVWRERYNITGHKNLTVSVYLLAGIRIALCMMPQNRWTVANPPLSWGIYRNIPFALLGLLIIVLYFRSAKAQNDRAFRWMWFTIVLSFGCYLPVVLFAETIPVMGALMIPKTCAYLWAVVIGFRARERDAELISQKQFHKNNLQSKEVSVRTECGDLFVAFCENPVALTLFNMVVTIRLPKR